MCAKKIFICYSGVISGEIVEKFKKTILDHPEIIPQSAHDGKLGDVWHPSVMKKIEDADDHLVLVTPSTARMPWVSFEGGAIYMLNKDKKNNLKGSIDNKKKRKKEEEESRVKVMLIEDGSRFKETLFKHFRDFKGMDQNALIKYLADILPSPDEARRHVDEKFPEWETGVADIFKKYKGTVDHTLERFRGLQVDFTAPLENKLYSKIIHDYLDSTIRILSELNDRHEILAVNYPHILYNLQNDLKVITNSIAVYNDVETFWNTAIGVLIHEGASDKSIRIFVYQTKNQLEKDFSNLRKYSENYGIYAISKERLLTLTNSPIQDYAIIADESTLHQMVAEYNRNKRKKSYVTIDFRTSDHKILPLQKEFDRVKNMATKITGSITLESLKNQIFPNEEI